MWLFYVQHQFEETSWDAHHRILSVASLQQQLVVTRLGQVELRPYLTDLCTSIAASMIRDQDRISLTVETDASVTDADHAVSLGLIVTELIINALKHAFPGQRGGRVAVCYRSEGSGWTLSVVDNGVGIASDPESAKPGLGTSIVEALAKQLQAQVEVDARGPGTRVSIVHQQAS